MSLKLEGQTCPVCHAYLFDDDDVVYCPECGAPHHRDCYNSIGHCGLEQLHGTPQQYDLQRQAKLKEESAAAEREHKFDDAHTPSLTVCKMCGEKYASELGSCPKCGAPNLSRAGSPFAEFDFLGGVPADLDIGDGVTADEAKRFVVSNTPRYVRKFAVLNRKNKISWNWLAFFFPCAWLLSRKMYKRGIIVGVLTVAATLLLTPLSRIMYSNGFTSLSYPEMLQGMNELLPKIGTAVMVFAGIGVLCGLLIRLFTAMFADYNYKCYTVASIKQIKAESDDIDFDFRKKGGVNLVAMMLGIMVIEYLPSIIAALI